MTLTKALAEAFACHDASCRPPTSGGTGGSKARGGFGGLSEPRDSRVAPTPAFTMLNKRTLDHLGAPAGGTTKERAAKFVGSWYEHDLPGGFKSRVTEVDRSQEASGVYVVSGEIVNRHGDYKGEFQRTVDTNSVAHYETGEHNPKNPYLGTEYAKGHLSDLGGIAIKHDSLELTESAQGQGLGEAFNSAALAEYRKYGVDRIKVHAANEVGGYAWARAGFRLDDGTKIQFGDYSEGYFTRHYQLEKIATQARSLIEDKQAAGALDPNTDFNTHLATLDKLMKASEAGQDVQPIHIASIGEDGPHFTAQSPEGSRYDSWAGKEMMLGNNWTGTYYLNASVQAAAFQYFNFDPHQPRNKEGEWTAHRGRITSLSQNTLDRAISKGAAGIFGDAPTGTVPWPTAPRLKGQRQFDPALVEQALRSKQAPEPVDPRILYATQPGLTKHGVEYYRSAEYKATGALLADRENAGNATPVVYVNARGQHILLSGHHRAAAALIDGTDLNAVVVRESMTASAVRESICVHGALVAACHDTSCRPPTSGGTGGSKVKGAPNGTARHAEIAKQYGINLKGVGNDGVSYINDKDKLQVDQFKDFVPENLSGAIRVRVSTEALEKIVKDGQVKTQHETGTSGGMFAPYKRDAIEAEMFGEENTRPIYGYIDGTNSAIGKPPMTGGVNFYGGIALVLKDNVIDRTTVTYGDSLVESWPPAPLPVRDVHGLPNDEAGTFRRKTAIVQDGSYYIEAQIHGGIKLSDIAEIVVARGQPMSYIETLVPGIPVSRAKLDVERQTDADFEATT